jgi:hypothetical protein
MDRMNHACDRPERARIPDWVQIPSGSPFCCDFGCRDGVVSRITIFKQAKAGRIPSFRIGTCVRFDPKIVANWLR